MEAIVFIIAIVALGAFSLRFGQDSREGLRSKEQELAACGVSWSDLEQESKQPYPTLAFIEGALGDAVQPLSKAPNALALEARARELVAEYWPDTVWTTGIVPAAAFRRVLADLAPDAFEASVGVSTTPAAIKPGQLAHVEPNIASSNTENPRQGVVRTTVEPYAAA